MTPYPKIQTIFKRDPETNFKTLLEGNYSLPVFEYLRDCEWYATEKVDGTNIRIICDADGITIKGKTDNAQIPGKLFNTLTKQFMDLYPKLINMFPAGVCLYGEGYGAGIQKGGNYRPDQNFVLFDVKVDEFWLLYADIKEIADELRLDVVPIMLAGVHINQAITLVRHGFKSTWGDFMAEGLVIQPCEQLFTRNGERVITKLKYKDFVRS